MGVLAEGCCVSAVDELVPCRATPDPVKRRVVTRPHSRDLGPRGACFEDTTGFVHSDRSLNVGRWAGVVVGAKSTGPVGAHGSIRACDARNHALLHVPDRVHGLDALAIEGVVFALPIRDSARITLDAVLDCRGSGDWVERVARTGLAELGSVGELVVSGHAVRALSAVSFSALRAPRALAALVQLRRLVVDPVPDRAAPEMVHTVDNVPHGTLHLLANDDAIAADEPRRTPLALVDVGIDNVLAEKALGAVLGVVRELPARCAVQGVDELMPCRARKQFPRRVVGQRPLSDYGAIPSAEWQRLRDAAARIDSEGACARRADASDGAVHAHGRALRRCQVEQAVALAVLDVDASIKFGAREGRALQALVPLGRANLRTIGAQGAVPAQVRTPDVLVLARGTRRAHVAKVLVALLAQAARLALLKPRGEVVEAVALGAALQLQLPVLFLPDRAINHLLDIRRAVADQPWRAGLAFVHVRQDVLHVFQTLEAHLGVVAEHAFRVLRSAVDQLVAIGTAVERVRPLGTVSVPLTNHRLTIGTAWCGSGFLKALAVRAQRALGALVARRRASLDNTVVMPERALAIRGLRAARPSGERRCMALLAVCKGAGTSPVVVGIHGAFAARVVAVRILEFSRCALHTDGAGVRLTARPARASLTLLELRRKVVEAVARRTALQLILIVVPVPNRPWHNRSNSVGRANEAWRAGLAGVEVVEHVLLTKDARTALLSLVAEGPRRRSSRAVDQHIPSRAVLEQLRPVGLLRPLSNRQGRVRALAIGARKRTASVGTDCASRAGIAPEARALRDGVVARVADALLDAGGPGVGCDGMLRACGAVGPAGRTGLAPVGVERARAARLGPDDALVRARQTLGADRTPVLDALLAEAAGLAFLEARREVVEPVP
mmetsp:Transcript_49063/g.116512  ORF Transcript_49063/g.116512 Transcript_49063/m.116512 type:complete len:898 (+) Transcript_49063:4799-7492(+)